jgi:hypothetical protein
MLLEIGLWKMLPDIKSVSRRTFGDRWQEEWKEEMIKQAEKMKRDMGQIYSDVVVKLLRGLKFEEHRGEFWADIVLALSKCNA